MTEPDPNPTNRTLHVQPPPEARSMYPPISQLVPDVVEHPVEVAVDVAEEVTAILYEFVGHMASDVGTAGYEYSLVQRAGFLARTLQAAIIVSVRQRPAPPPVG